MSRKVKRMGKKKKKKKENKIKRKQLEQINTEAKYQRKLLIAKKIIEKLESIDSLHEINENIRDCDIINLVINDKIAQPESKLNDYEDDLISTYFKSLDVIELDKIVKNKRIKLQSKKEKKHNPNSNDK